MNKTGIVKNPLSVIAIFAGVAEISGTSVLPFISEENQRLYIWFLMTFPFTLVLLFFATLNWNHKSLYAPSDFKSDESFLESANSENSKRTDIASMEKIIEEKVSETLRATSDNDSFNKDELAKKITDSIKDSAFITVDARTYTGKNDNIFELPYVALSSLNRLTDEVYFLLKGAVDAYEYGYSWVLEREVDSIVIKNARMITGERRGVPLADNRALEEVGITPGAVLKVVKPAHNKAMHRTSR